MRMRRILLAACCALGVTTGCASEDETVVGTQVSAPAASVAAVATSPPPTSEGPTTTGRSSTTAASTVATTTAVIVATTAPPPAYTVEELSGTLGPAAQAWAVTPSGPTYDALAQTAEAVLASGRPLPALPGGPAGALLQQLTVYPGSDLAVLAIFDGLGPALPAISRDAFTTTLPPLPQPAIDLGGGTDPRFDTCGDAVDAGYGPYRQGEPEYSWYRDADGDGVVCES